MKMNEKLNLKKKSLMAMAIVGVLATSSIVSFADQAQTNVLGVDSNQKTTSTLNSSTNKENDQKNKNDANSKNTNNKDNKKNTDNKKDKNNASDSSNASNNENSKKSKNNKTKSKDSSSETQDNKTKKSKRKNKSNKLSEDEKIAQANVKISKEQAEKIALENVPGGTVKKTFFKAKSDQPRYKVEVMKDNVEHEVKIDANTGSVISNEIDNNTNDDKKAGEKMNKKIQYKN